MISPMSAPVAETAITVGATSTVTLAAATLRSHATLQADPFNTEPIYIGLGVAAVQDKGIALYPGQSYTITQENLYAGVVYSICASGGQTLRVSADVAGLGAYPGNDGTGAATTAAGLSPAGSAAHWSTGQGDFTAVYASATTLTLGTFPSALGTPVSGDFIMVVVTRQDGTHEYLVPTVNGMTLAGQVLTVTGAAFVTDGSADLKYDVFCWGPPKAYAAAEDANQDYQVNPEHAWLQSPILVEATDVTDATVYYYMDFDMYKFGAIRLALDCDAGTVTATLEASLRDDGTAQDLCEYDDVMTALSISSVVSTAAPATGLWLLNTPLPIKYLRVKVVYATTANTGDATILTRATY